jgi:hypothetical protein
MQPRIKKEKKNSPLAADQITGTNKKKTTWSHRQSSRVGCRNQLSTHKSPLVMPVVFRRGHAGSLQASVASANSSPANHPWFCAGSLHPTVSSAISPSAYPSGNNLVV